MLFNMYLLTKVSKKKIFGTIRVIAYGLVVSAGLGALTIRTAVADAENQGLEVGRQLAGLGDLLQGANEFRLNDQKIFFSMSTTDQPMATVLDRFENHCNNAKAFDALEWKSLAAVEGKALPRQKSMSRFGVTRKDDEKAGDGMVVCFTRDNGPRDFFKALQAFEASGDLHDLGDVRYAHVKQTRAKDGSLNGSLVQTMWTEGSFNLRTIMGTPGQDAAGSDFVSIPRPMNSTRRFTAEAVGKVYAARIYESNLAPDVILGDYKAKMEAQGWLTIKSPDAQYGEGNDGRWFMRPETAEQVAVAVRRNGDKTMTVVGSMGISDKAPASLTRPY